MCQDLIILTQTPIETEFAAALDGERAERFLAALPGARAAILARLRRALAIEPLPQVSSAEAEYVHPVDLLTALRWRDSGSLITEVAHSVAGLALSRTTSPLTTPFLERSLEEHEQSVVDGHPLHPCCRNRTGFTARDHLAYGPEHRPVVALRLHPTGNHVVFGDWPAELRDGSQILLPLHPWQADLLNMPTTGTLDARPLMALRTLSTGAWHVKTTLSAQITSAVRDISGGSIATATTVSDFLSATVEGIELQHNRASAAVLTDGEPDRALGVILRDKPVPHPQETLLPLAALSARPVDGGPPPVRGLGDPVTWLAEFAELAVPPLMTLLARGVALEAHEQNLVIGLVNGRPSRLIYRDLADIRVSPRANLPERLHASPESLRAKTLATFFATALTGLVTALDAPAAELWQAVAKAVPDTPDRHALLHDPIPAKPLTLMRLDPATTAWAYLPNPF
ncbi:IucA/IucC family siderophore biosynthesis protein [Lentzea sp. BCCO 10_0856]|uniref:IucA/IucC family siderophore biosynthesis protein n=1 Tax=Lentzea miocenica TaxID=3095431 RepID=A0ABU4T562_9PSEU|nr:IucA/IucC family siderophore biosynthesis protein [Lentzea sp. BCCO 10_0856]MDX8033250.1 IucA/IucC family siderophore biosynthesis protein [Lentzea sp. BCCO 10_0856]